MLLQPSGTDASFDTISGSEQWNINAITTFRNRLLVSLIDIVKKKETNKSQSLIFSLPLLVPENCFLFTIYTIPAFICSLREFQNKFGNRNLNGTLKILSTSSTSCYISVSTGL